MADLFGRVDQVHNGGLTADSLFMTWPAIAAAGGGLGLLIQNVGLNYRQMVRKVFEIGPGLIPGGGGFRSAALCDVGVGPQAAGCTSRTQPVYFIAARPDGQMQFGRIFGFRTLSQVFFRTYGNPCNIQNNLTLQAKAGCNGSTPTATTFWDMTGVLLDTYSMNATAQEMVLQEQLNAQFVGFNIRDTDNDGAAGGGAGGQAGGGNVAGANVPCASADVELAANTPVNFHLGNDDYQAVFAGGRVTVANTNGDNVGEGVPSGACNDVTISVDGTAVLFKVL